MPSQSLATKAATASSCTLAIVRSSMRGGTTSSIPPSSYFAEKSYQSDESGTISPGIDAIGSSFPSTLHSTSTPADELLEEDLLVVLERERRLPGRARSGSFTIEMPTLEPSRAGFTTTGKPNGFSTRSRCRSRTVTLSHDGHALVAHHRLEEILVHAERRGGDAGADVGDVRELEKALHRAVLAEGPVQDGEDHVDALERRGRPVRGDGQRLAALADLGPARPGARAASARPGRSRRRARRSARGRGHRRRSAPTRPRCRARSSARP